jgi:hypothetical protein
MTNEKRLTDFQEQWEKLVNKANNNYSLLSKAERVWFNIQLLIASVENGGMISCFYNSLCDYYVEIIEDLKELKHDKIIKLMEEIGKMFPKGIVPKDMEKRNEVINCWSYGKYDRKLYKIDKTFFKLKNKLENDLIKYIITNNLREPLKT